MPPFRRWNRFPGRYSPYRWRGPVYNRVVEYPVSYPVAYPVEYPVYVPVSTPEKNNTAQSAVNDDNKSDNNKVYMGIFALLFIFIVIIAMRR